MEKMEKASSASSRKKHHEPGASRISLGRRPPKEVMASEKVDAIELLKEQHRAVERLFSEFEEESDDDAALELARTICQKLTVHATIEEEIFYPAARAKEELKDMVLEALEEHHSVKRLIADIEETEAGDETLDAKLSVLEEQVTHHVKEEERGLFPRAKKAFAKEERQAMGERLRGRSEALEAQAGPDSAARPARNGH